MTDNQGHWANDGKCRDCEHYHRTDIAQGECWRYPPVPYPLQSQMGAVQVISVRAPTQAESTCGEWRSNEFGAQPGSDKPIDVQGKLIG